MGSWSRGGSWDMLEEIVIAEIQNVHAWCGRCEIPLFRYSLCHQTPGLYSQIWVCQRSHWMANWEEITYRKEVMKCSLYALLGIYAAKVDRSSYTLLHLPQHAKWTVRCLTVELGRTKRSALGRVKLVGKMRNQRETSWQWRLEVFASLNFPVS